MHKRGADTLLGNLWWVIDPLLQMVVYVVFVTIIVSKSLPDYPLFIFSAILPWKWFSASVGDATLAVTSQDRLIKQIAFPKLVLPVAATTAGVVGFAFGLIPLGIPDAVLPGPDLAVPAAHPGHRRGPVRLHARRCRFLVAAGNVFFRDLGNVSRHVLRLWWYLSPGLYSLAALDELHVFQEHPDPARPSPA